jgi:hypothetical protein
MKQQTIQVDARVKVIAESVPGDLQVVGWERKEVMAKTDGSHLAVSGNSG